MDLFDLETPLLCILVAEIIMHRIDQGGKLSNFDYLPGFFSISLEFFGIVWFLHTLVKCLF